MAGGFFCSVVLRNKKEQESLQIVENGGILLGLLHEEAVGNLSIGLQKKGNTSKAMRRKDMPKNMIRLENQGFSKW